MEWFERFFGEDYLRFDRHEDTLAEVEFLERVLGLTPGGKILDLCCGYGRHAVELAQRGHCVSGFDLSAPLLRVGQRAAAARGVPVLWTRGDMRRLPYRAEFDGAISMFTSLGYFEEEADNYHALGAISQALRPGGRFVIETVNRDFLVKHFSPVGWSRCRDMLVLEERSFDVVRSRSQVRVTLLERGTATRLSHSIRVYGFKELEMLLASVGLVTLDVLGGFRGETFSWDADKMILVGERAPNG